MRNIVTGTVIPDKSSSSTINERLSSLIKTLGYNTNAFAKHIGKPQSSVSVVVDGRSKPGYDFLELVCLKFPNVSRDWLLMGEGTMFRDTSAIPSQQMVSADSGYLHDQMRQLETSFVRLSSQLEKKDEQIAGLQRMLEMALGKSKGVPSSQVASQGIRTTPLQVTYGTGVGRVFEKLGS